MRKALHALFLLDVLCLFVIALSASAESRFGRPVVKVDGAQDYTFSKLDEVNYPSLTKGDYSVSCLVYRGTQHYYVEVTVTNKSATPVPLQPSFINFDKPGYGVYRGDTMLAAREAAVAAGMRFTPTPPPYVPPTYDTTIRATATTYGNQTYVSGTATTTENDSGQAGATIGNAIGNAIAAHRFYKMQRQEVAFSNFLASHLQTDADTPLQPGRSRTIVTVFDQSKQKKKPFTVTMKVGEESFAFSYKE